MSNVILSGTKCREESFKNLTVCHEILPSSEIEDSTESTTNGVLIFSGFQAGRKEFFL